MRKDAPMRFRETLLLPSTANAFNRVDHIFHLGSIQLSLRMDCLVARVPDLAQNDFFFQSDAAILRQEVQQSFCPAFLTGVEERVKPARRAVKQSFMLLTSQLSSQFRVLFRQ